ncbi:Receptor like protein 29 [Ancistrocladus abbreviatus]
MFLDLIFGSTPLNPTCKTTAVFPSEIFQLPHLQSVFFFHCFTHTKTTITLPINRVVSSSLEQLSLRSNPALVGQIPPQLSSLTSLQVLTISQNRLNGQNPTSDFQLKFIGTP